MNTSSIEVTWLSGAWIAKFSPCRATSMQTVSDAKGNPILYRDQKDAKIAAYDALLAEENRLNYLHLDPGQVMATPKFHEARSRAGKKRFADQAIKEAMREVTG